LHFVTGSIDILAAVGRSDRALVEQISRWEALEFGVAYSSDAFPTLAAANQLRDAWLEDVDGPTAYERAEAYYRERNLLCRAWSPASGQAIAPLEDFLVTKGWRRVEHLAMNLNSWNAVDGPTDPAFRVLPARAMPKAYRRSLTESGASEDETNAAFERLNDSNYDAFVAMFGDQPVGRAAYLEVGDIACLSELVVAPAHRGRGVARGLFRQVMQLARRLGPRAFVASVPADNKAGANFLKRTGFSPAGTLTQFVRPA
jgi:GNAT superfamily N-acetyltransferase